MAVTPATPSTKGPDLKPYEDKIIAALHEAETRIANFEAKAKENRQHAEVVAIEQLKVARKKLEQQLKTLGSASGVQIERAKKDIDAAAVGLKASLDELSKTLSSAPAKEGPTTVKATAERATPEKTAPAKPTSEKTAAPEKK